MPDETKDTGPSLYDAYATDTNAEQEGQWVSMRDESEWRIRADTSDRVRQYINKQMRGQRQQILAAGGLLPPKLADANEIAICRDVLVTGFRKVRDRAGQEVTYSKAAVEKILTDLPRLRADILMASRTEETYRAPVVEAMSGNSESTSPKS